MKSFQKWSNWSWRCNLVVFALVLVLFGWLTFGFYFGERVWQNHGAGWDGTRYIDYAVNLDRCLAERSVTSYHFKHILPSAIVHLGSRVLNIPLTSMEIAINAFHLYNILIVMVGCVLFGLIARNLEWPPALIAIGFAGVFLNFPVLKLLCYYPALTDFSAMVVGLAMLYCFVCNRYIGLVVVSLLGSFVYPSIVYAALPLLLFPATLPVRTLRPEGTKAIVLRVFPAAVVVGLALYRIVTGWILPGGANQPMWDRLPLSLVGVLVYLYIVSGPFADWRYFVECVKAQWAPVRIAAAAGVFLFVQIVVFTLSSNNSMGTSLTRQILAYAVVSVANPLCFLVSHIAYFGPLVFLLIFFWQPFAQGVSECGVGLTMFVVLYLMLSINTESRQLLNAWPIFAMLLCQSLDRSIVTWRLAVPLVAASLLVSKCWLPINTEPFPPGGDFLTFPYQRFFMNFGPWMSNEMYQLHAVAAIGLGVFFYQLVSRQSASASVGVPIASCKAHCESP